MREILEALLTREGYRVRLAGTAEEGLELARSVPFDAAIVDVMLPGMDGITALDELKKINDEMPVLMITAFASVESAIAAMKRGAFDYITKPFKNDEVLIVVRNAVERGRLVEENRIAPADRPGAVSQLRQHHRPQPADEAGVRPHHPGGAQPFDDPDPGRERHGQGAGRPGHPHALSACRPRVRDRQLGEPAARPPRVHAVRPREGRVHGRALPEEGPLRSRRQGQHLLRRDGERSARDAGQAAARDAGAGVHAARRHGDDPGGRPHHRRHQHRSPQDGRGRTLPRGPVLPPARHRDRAAAAAGPHDGHPAAGAALPHQVRRGERQARPGAVARGARPDDGLRLAGQRPRARERDRARRRPVQRRGASARI